MIESNICIFAKQAIDSRVNQTAGTVYVSNHAGLVVEWTRSACLARTYCNAKIFDLRVGPEREKPEKEKKLKSQEDVDDWRSASQTLLSTGGHAIEARSPTTLKMLPLIVRGEGVEGRGGVWNACLDWVGNSVGKMQRCDASCSRYGSTQVQRGDKACSNGRLGAK